MRLSWTHAPLLLLFPLFLVAESAHASTGVIPPTYGHLVVHGVPTDPAAPDYDPLYSGASGMQQVVPADVDGDGDVDLVVISRYRDRLAWYENDGQPVTPGFIEHVVVDNPYGIYAVPRPLPEARSVAVGDLDGDGDLDLLSASALDDKIAWYENQGGSPVAFTPHVLTQDPDGAFPQQGPVDEASWVSVADLDGDGDLDVLAAGYGGAARWFQNQGGAASWVSFDLGAGYGGSGYCCPPPPGPIILAADLDGDGDLDIVRAAAGGLTRAGAWVWQENSGGATPSFPRRGSGGFGANDKGLSVGDLDGDGDLDVIAAGNDGVHWFSNDGGSPRQFADHLLSGAPLLRAICGVHAVDFDGDGDLDVLAVAEGPGFGLEGGLHLLENRAGDASKWVWRPLSMSARRATSVAAADLNGDGHMDALSTSRDGETLVWHPWRGSPNVSLTLSLESAYGPMPFQPVAITGVGVAQIQSDPNGALERLDIVAGFVGAGIGRVIPPPVSVTDYAFEAARPALGLGTGRFERGAGPARIPLTGLQRLSYLVPSTVPPGVRRYVFPLPLSEGGRGAGAGGTVVFGSSTRISVLGAPWTVGTASTSGYTPSGPSSVATFSARGFAHGPLSNTGTTARDGGALQLVTPIRFQTFWGPAPIVHFARLTVRFIPEPAPLLALGVGALALAWLGRRRIRRKEAD